MNNIKFNANEKKIVRLLNSRKTIPEIARKLGDHNREKIKYVFAKHIAPKVLESEQVQKVYKKPIVLLEKEFGPDAFLVGRVLGKESGKTFSKSKMVVVDNRFKTADNTSFKPLPIQECMKKGEKGKEAPTSLDHISECLNMTKEDLVTIIEIFFKENVFIQDHIILSTSRNLSVFIPNYFFVNDNGEKRMEQIFTELRSDERFFALTKNRKPLQSFSNLTYYVKMQFRGFSTKPFLRYDTGYEVRKYFYNKIVPKDLNVDNLIKNAVEFAKKSNPEELFCLRDFLKDTNHLALNFNIVRSILIDSGYFSGVVRKTFYLKFILSDIAHLT